MVHAGINAGMSTGDGTWMYMQLLCRHQQNQYYNLEPESHYLWPYGEFLRLYHIAPLPSPMPDIRAPLMPPLQPGFTAAQALRRVTVKGTHHNECHPAASMFPEQLVACFCDTNEFARQVCVCRRNHAYHSTVTAIHHVLRMWLFKPASISRGILHMLAQTRYSNPPATIWKDVSV